MIVIIILCWHHGSNIPWTVDRDQWISYSLCNQRHPGFAAVNCLTGVLRVFIQPVFPWSQEKVVSGRSCSLPFRNHTFLEGKVAVAFISESCYPVIPAQWYRQMLENAMRIDHLRACVKRVARK
jgi:hypothetical protein